MQLEDYFRGHQLKGADSAATRIYHDSCARLIAEGGADYDFHTVNPATVLAVLEGRRVNTHLNQTGPIYEIMLAYGLL